MKPDFFKNLPPEIITEIFLRLPVVSVPISKCVCKRWLHLLESDDFVKSHFARSAPALVVLGDSGRLKVLEWEGELDPLTQYDFPYRPREINTSVNGSWRRLEGINPYVYQYDKGAFVNGNLHWTASIGEDSSWISCFDVETECFSFFKAPPYHAQGLPFTRGRSLCALSGCLWFCEEAFEYENDGGRCELTIWIMKEYGVGESWSLAYVIPLVDNDTFLVDPIKVSDNGDLLILLEGRPLTVSTVGFSLPPLFHSKL
ncbi:putative F-box protein At2g19630 isoform X4 [Salvia miltiorrhiza]|uniref:putative F-box protein At2g19630 isoform X4 n=1 Tax=Salvia miltiorrhiza TaxID=226208 RepID=UPI0025AD5A3F|nr:putative F-box protein At2g19630 isoform X4 [Salvia miltiorrhiza]